MIVHSCEPKTQQLSLLFQYKSDIYTGRWTAYHLPQNFFRRLEDPVCPSPPIPPGKKGETQQRKAVAAVKSIYVDRVRG